LRLVGATDSRCGYGDLGFGGGLGFAETDGGAWVGSRAGGETFAIGLSFSRQTTTSIEEGIGRWRFARFGSSALQVEGFVEGVGRSALSGGGTGAYRLPSDAEYLAVGQGTDAGTVYR
jgi:hypothetical protein